MTILVALYVRIYYFINESSHVKLQIIYFFLNIKIIMLIDRHLLP